MLFCTPGCSPDVRMRPPKPKLLQTTEVYASFFPQFFIHRIPFSITEYMRNETRGPRPLWHPSVSLLYHPVRLFLSKFPSANAFANPPTLKFSFLFIVGHVFCSLGIHYLHLKTLRYQCIEYNFPIHAINKGWVYVFFNFDVVYIGVNMIHLFIYNWNYCLQWRRKYFHREPSFEVKTGTVSMYVSWWRCPISHKSIELDSLIAFTAFWMSSGWVLLWFLTNILNKQTFFFGKGVSSMYIL